MMEVTVDQYAENGDADSSWKKSTLIPLGLTTDTEGYDYLCQKGLCISQLTPGPYFAELAYC